MLSRRQFIGAVAALPSVASAQGEWYGATALRCEYAENPVGIDTRPPRFSWQLTSGMQSAYRVVVASGGAAIWDSGKVVSPQSAHVPYGGSELKSRQQCQWWVRVWDQDGRASDFSVPARFEMGLLDPGDWKAQWIGAPDAAFVSGTRTPPSPYLRKSFHLDSVPKSARAYVCGLGFYELRLNRRKVGDYVLSPNQTDYGQRQLRGLLNPSEDRTTKRVLYVTYDVTEYLREGENVVGLILGNGWYDQRDRDTEGQLWYGTPRAILQLEADEGELLAASEESWRITTAGPIVRNGIFTGEDYDARLEIPGWDEGGFDDVAWTNAVTLSPPTGTLRAQASLPDKVVETLRPVAVTSSKPGLYTFDAGRNLSGWARLGVRGPRSRKLTLRFREEMGPDYGQFDSYVLKGGATEIWEPRFTWHGFRHVDVTGAPEPPELEIRVAHSAVERAGTFECSNTLFNRIHETYVRTQLANMHGGVPSDCPHRERLGYTGDGHVAAQSAIYALDMARFYTKWIDDIGDARNHETGYVPHTAPFEGGRGGPPWGSAMVLMPWYMYLYYGDRRAIENHYQAMTAWVQYLGTRTDADGIVVKEEPGGWFLGDWRPPEKIVIPPELVCTCYYAHCADLAARVARILGREPEAVSFAALAAKVGGAMHRRFYDAARNQYADGGQGANFFPLAFGLVPGEFQKAVFERAVSILVDGNHEHFDTGFLATPLVLDVLTARGRADLAYRLMNQTDFPSFGHILAQGATTLWEDWNGRSSHMHPMFGGACRWFWQALAGINPDPQRPGFEHILVTPRPVEDLQWVKAEYRCLRGTIGVEWTRKADAFQMQLAVPANTEATVALPGEEKATKVGPGRHTLMSRMA